MFENKHLAIASVPLQRWGQVYDENEAFEKGTVFPQLNKPFFVTEQEHAGAYPGMSGKSSGQVKTEDRSADRPSVMDKGARKSQDFEDADRARRREEMLLNIQKVSFVVDDMRLYMDTHPSDSQGLSLLKQMILKRRKLLREYALQFAPLTMDCMADIYEEHPDSDCYCWQKGPIPWEGACV